MITIDKSADYTMKMATTCGEIDIALKTAAAPHTVNSFNFLAAKGFFDHTKCHRLTTNGIYVLQCGDPTGTGSGTPGYTIPDENLKDKTLTGGVYPAGTVAMANTYDATTDKGRDTGGSQFFLVYQDSQLLYQLHTVRNYFQVRNDGPGEDRQSRREHRRGRRSTQRDRRDQQDDRDEILTASCEISVARDADSRPAGRLCWP